VSSLQFQQTEERAMPYQVLIDTQLNDEILSMIGDDCDLHLWQGDATDPAILQQIEAYFTYGHPKTDGTVMDRMPKLRLISNFGVGVDHIDLAILASYAIFPSGSNRSRSNRNTALALLYHPVCNSRTFMHFTHTVNAPRIK